MQRPLLVIGNGMATARLLKDLVELGFPGHSIRVIGQEPRVAYNRIMLSSWLSGDVGQEALELQGVDWYSDHDIELITGHRVIDLDVGLKRAVCDTGDVFTYEQLVLATGSSPLIPEVPGIELPGVVSFRTVEDVQAMREWVKPGSNAVVLGGGLLGLEAAEGLRRMNANVHVLQRADWLMNRQMDATAAGLLHDELHQRGLHIHCAQHIARIDGTNQVQSVTLASGQVIAADLVVSAIGIVPNVSLAENAGLKVDRAICVDAQMRTDAPGVYALGECCQFEGETFGLVAPIWDQSQTLSKVLAGRSAHYRSAPTRTQLKISGIELFSCGRIGTDDAQAVEYRDMESGHYRKLWTQAGQVTGAVMIGDASCGPRVFDALCSGKHQDDQGFGLLLGD